MLNLKFKSYGDITLTEIIKNITEKEYFLDTALYFSNGGKNTSDMPARLKIPISENMYNLIAKKIEAGSNGPSNSIIIEGNLELKVKESVAPY